MSLRPHRLPTMWELAEPARPEGLCGLQAYPAQAAVFQRLTRGGQCRRHLLAGGDQRHPGRVGPEVFGGGLPHSALHRHNAGRAQQRRADRAARRAGRGQDMRRCGGGRRSGLSHAASTSASRSSASSASQGPVIASTFGPQTISGSKPFSGADTLRPPHRSAAAACRHRAQKSPGGRVRAAAQDARVLQLFRCSVKSVQAGAPCGKGLRTPLRQPTGTAVQTDEQRVARRACLEGHQADARPRRCPPDCR